MRNSGADFILVRPLPDPRLQEMCYGHRGSDGCCFFGGSPGRASHPHADPGPSRAACTGQGVSRLSSPGESMGSGPAAMRNPEAVPEL